MADSYSSKVQLWEGWMPALAKGPAPPTAMDRSSLTRPYRLEFADRLYAGEALHANGRIYEGAEPFTLQWFLDIENSRHGRQGRWIPRLLEFVKHGGETLLGLGNGLGTDWIQYARHGAEVIACCPAAEQLALIQRNFALRGLNAVFLHANPRTIPLESASIDVACVANLLEDVSDPSTVIEEIYRLLKPGGKVLAVTAGAIRPGILASPLSSVACLDTSANPDQPGGRLVQRPDAPPTLWTFCRSSRLQAATASRRGAPSVALAAASHSRTHLRTLVDYQGVQTAQRSNSRAARRVAPLTG